MAIRLPSTSSLLAFESTARQGSFSGAARELSISQSTVSYRVRQLEQCLGVSLFQRQHPHTPLTPAGLRLLPRVQALLQGLEQALEEVRQQPLLRVRLSTYFALRWLSPRLRHWQGADVILVHEEGGTAEVRIHWERDTGPSSRLLMATPMRAYVAPALLPSLKSPADILTVALLCEPPTLDMWPAWCQAAGLELANNVRRITLADSNVRVQAAVDGLGAVLADPLIASEVQGGKLVSPFEITASGGGFCIDVGPNPGPETQRFVAWLQGF